MKKIFVSLVIMSLVIVIPATAAIAQEQGVEIKISLMPDERGVLQKSIEEYNERSNGPKITGLHFRIYNTDFPGTIRGIKLTVEADERTLAESCGLLFLENAPLQLFKDILDRALSEIALKAANEK